MMPEGSLRELMRRVDGVLWFKTPGTHHHTRSRCSRSRTSSRGPRRCPRRRRPSGRRSLESRSPRTRGREVLPPRAAPTAIEYVQRRGQPGGPWRICAVDLAGLRVKSAMWCKAMGRSRAISKNGDPAPLDLNSNQQLGAHSAHFHRVTRSRRANRTGFCTRLTRIKTSELAAQLLVAYETR